MPHFPKTLGIYHLQKGVLFPHAHLSLTVYDPGEVALVQQAAAEPQMILTLGPSTGDPKCDDCTVGCAACIIQHELLPGGEGAAIVLRGERTVSVEGVLDTVPYAQARVRPRTGEGSFCEEPGAAERLQELLELLEEASPGMLERLRPRLLFAPEDDGGMELLHTLAMHMPVSLEKKLSWLRRPGSMARWLGIRETLRCLAEVRRRRRRTLLTYADLYPHEADRN